MTLIFQELSVYRELTVPYHELTVDYHELMVENSLPWAHM